MFALGPARMRSVGNIAHKGDNNEEDGDGDDIAAQRPCGADTTNAGHVISSSWAAACGHVTDVGTSPARIA